VKRHLWTLALVVLPMHSQVRDNAVPPIAIYYGFQHEASAEVLGGIQKEVGEIMTPMLPPFEWRRLDAVRGGEVSEDLAVVNFKGTCEVGDLMPDRSSPGALGQTHVTDHVVLPFSDVDCDRVRNYLRPSLLALSPRKREQVYARALGRVLAHELYHIFAKTTHHDGAGVARARFTAAELTAEKFRLSEGSIRPLRSVLASTRAPLAVGRSLYKTACAQCHGAKGEGAGANSFLRLAGRPWDFVRLATQLGKKHSKMTKDAKGLGLEWPHDDTEMSSLVGYLNSFHDEQ